MRLILSSGAGTIIGLLILTACSQATANSDLAALEPASAPCPAAEYQALVGQIAGEIDMASLPRPAVLLEDGETTAGINLQRMTMKVGGDGRVAEVGCG